MKIAVIGAGAMGALFGSYLSRQHAVTLVDVNEALVRQIDQQGVLVTEPDGTQQRFFPAAVCDAGQIGPMDLVIVFVKAMYSRACLEENRNLIGPDTYLMTLQNGGGHESTLLQFVNREKVIIGTTQHNSAMPEPGKVCHGGAGPTHIGTLTDSVTALEPFARAFTACGLPTDSCLQVQKLIWDKLFTNVSASVLTAVLQVPLGYISRNEAAWALCKTLIREAVAVAGANGILFDPDQKIAEVHNVCENSPNGYTSIYADLKSGRKSEVDTISGYVVRASLQSGVPAPTHEAMVQLIHAMEQRFT